MKIRDDKLFLVQSLGNNLIKGRKDMIDFILFYLIWLGWQHLIAIYSKLLYFFFHLFIALFISSFTSSFMTFNSLLLVLSSIFLLLLLFLLTYFVSSIYASIVPFLLCFNPLTCFDIFSSLFVLIQICSVLCGGNKKKTISRNTNYVCVF